MEAELPAPKKKRAPRRKPVEKVVVAEPEPPVQEEPRSVESVLSRRSDRDAFDRTPPTFDRPHATSKDFVLAIAVFILFAVASTGVMMFVRKNGAPNISAFVSNIFQKKSTVDVESTTTTTPSTPSVPSSISTIFVVTTAAKKDDTSATVVSRFIETDVKATETFPATGEGIASTAKSSGKATIVNTTSKPYTFVKTTRLLSKDGVLFRMKETTPIPANGSVVVDVAADQPGPQGDIGPTTFTIPGLPPAAQKEVYAKSGAAMTGGSGKGQVVSEVDITNAKTALTEKLKKEADDNFASIVGDGEKLVQDLVTATELALVAPKPGTPGVTFSLTRSLRYRALLVPEKAVLPLLTAAMTAALPSGTSAADYSLGSVLYTVQAYDTTIDRAEVRAEASLIGGK